MLEAEFNHFLLHQDALLNKYLGQFLVICKEEVVGNYKTLEEAYVASASKFPVGSFLIQECLPGKDGYLAHVGTN